MAEIAYIPNPREGMTPASREYDCDCIGGAGGAGATGATGAAGAAGADGAAGFVAPGSGSPEGVVTASPGMFYADSASNSIWVKETGTGTNTGWEQYLA